MKENRTKQSAFKLMITTQVYSNYLNTQNKSFNFESLLYKDKNFNDKDLDIANQIKLKIQNSQFNDISKREWLQFEYYRLKLSILEYSKKDIQDQLNKLVFIGHANEKDGKLFLTMVVSFNIRKSSAMVRAALGVTDYDINTFEGKAAIDFDHDDNKFHALNQLIQNFNNYESSFISKPSDSQYNFYNLLNKLSFFLRSNTFTINTTVKDSSNWNNKVYDNDNTSCLDKLSENNYKLASELFSDNELNSFKTMYKLIADKDKINNEFYLFNLYACIKLNYFINTFNFVKDVYIDSNTDHDLEVERRRQNALKLTREIEMTGTIFKNNTLFLGIKFPKLVTQNLVRSYSNLPLTEIVPKYYEKSLRDYIENLSSHPEYQTGKTKVFSSTKNSVTKDVTL